jgi:hypothetical protein
VVSVKTTFGIVVMGQAVLEGHPEYLDRLEADP